MKVHASNNVILRVIKMTQQVKALATKPDDLSSIPGPTQWSQELNPEGCPLTHMQINRGNEQIEQIDGV